MAEAQARLLERTGTVDAIDAFLDDSSQGVRRGRPTSAVGVPGSLEPVYSPQASKMLDLVEAEPGTRRSVERDRHAIDLICDAAPERQHAGTPCAPQLVAPPGTTPPATAGTTTTVVLWQPRDDEALIAYIGPL